MDEITIKNILKAQSFGERSATDYLTEYINMSEIMHHHLNEKPDMVYLKYYDSDGKIITYTYQEFVKKVHQLSNFLLQSNIKKGNRIATFSHNHSDTVILYFASWVIGAVVVPVNVSEESGRVQYIVENSDAKMIFTRKEYPGKLKAASIPDNVQIVDFDEFDFDEYQDNINISYHVNKEDECLIVYTSGTTGNPKGVVLTQYNLMADALSISNWHKLHNDDVMMCVLPIHHVNGTVVTIMTTMFYGGKLILNQKFQTDTFLKRLEENNVKVVSVVPTLLQFLLHSEEESKNYDLKNFSHIICGAGPLTCEIAKNFEDRFGLRIAHGYGLSETTCYSCFVPVDLSKSEHTKWQNEYGFPSIGIPIECNQMEIQDDKGKSLDENEKGEIVIRGHNVMKYYFNNDEVNRKTFEFGWFRSGDEGFFKYDDKRRKYFFITGRIKELIIRGAVNISPLEIDEVLSMCKPVAAGIAVGFDNDWYGEEVGALVKLKDPQASDEEKEIYKNQILEHCKKHLPFFKSPKVIIFSDSIPVTSTGKYQRNRVKDLFQEWKEVQFKNN
ncbi:MAG TPA: class I adenylate-forming enzyme family protein [Ignavibacteria bacterium]|nr:class I adenylate-forming enzyme family protein [Ignavibacteria bacterium]HMR38978.1 class I adenylate-forming enzyme family protein [Ignavibacteria bacterium]